MLSQLEAGRDFQQQSGQQENGRRLLYSHAETHDRHGVDTQEKSGGEERKK